MLCLFSSAFHEAGHLFFMLIFHAKISALVFGGFGIRIERGESLISYHREAVISIGGIIFNGLLIFTFSVLYSFFGEEIYFAAIIINAVLALLNALPVCMLDGWNFLMYILLESKGEEKAEKIMVKISFAAVVAFGVFTVIYTAVWGVNVSLFAVCGYLFVTFCLSKH